MPKGNTNPAPANPLVPFTAKSGRTYYHQADFEGTVRVPVDMKDGKQWFEEIPFDDIMGLFTQFMRHMIKDYADDGEFTELLPVFSLIQDQSV